LIASPAEMDRVQPGDIRTDMTDPDWEPVMKRAACYLPQRRTCHAAIVARTGHPRRGRHRRGDRGTQHGEAVTVSCAGATPAAYAGRVFGGR
jgi:hypothetical protein